MKPIKKLLVLLILLLWMVAAVVSAQESPRFALVIGNSEYEYTTRLTNPVNDATDVGVVLRSIGFNTTVVLDADIGKMEDEVFTFAEKLRRDPNSAGIFYYAGHAVQYSGVNYLLPVDADIHSENELRRKALSAQEILDYISEAQNSFNMVVLDACRDNPFAGSFRSIQRGLAVTAAAPPETLVVYATDAGNVANDGEGRNSPFTEAFLANVTQPGIDVEIMVRNVMAEVQQKTNHKQRPWKYSSVTSAFQLVPKVTDDLKPVLVATEYTVIFDTQGGGASEPLNKKVPFNSNYGTLPEVRRIGYTFGGWWTGSGGTGTQTNAQTMMTRTEDHFLYAKWQKKVIATGGEFVINNGAEPESLDPHLIEGIPDHSICLSLFEGLTTYDPETALAVPGLAKSWDITNDGMTYTFHLREAYWTDGVKITAQQFVDSWIRELDPATGSPSAWFLSMFIKGAAAFTGGDAGPEAVQIRALDEMTFQIDLIGPLPYVLDALPHYAFAVVPLHAIEKYGDEWTLPENFVCNGPFILDEWKPQKYLSVVPNKDYWDAGAINLDKVIYLPIDDNNTAHNMYLNGEADWNNSLPLNQMDAVKLRDDYQKAPYIGTYYYLFENTTPPTDDVRVRKALSMAIDRQSLVDLITRGGQLPAYAMVPGMAGFPTKNYFEEDVDVARALLADAGYPNGQGWPEGIQILYNTSEGHKKIGEYIQQQWKENLGIDVELINMEWGTYFKNRRTHDFVISRAGWIGDYPDPNTMLDMFITGGGGNDGQYSNAGFDAAINKAARMEPGTARYDVLREAEDYFIGEDMGVMPIYFFTSNNLIDLDVWGGWYVNVMDYHPTKDIYLK